MFLRQVILLSVIFVVFTSCKSKSKSSTTGSSSSAIYTVSGTIDGLLGTVVLQNNLTDNLSVSADGTFTFATKLDDAAAYSVTVLTNPTGQNCTVDSGGSGTIATADVTDVVINCDYQPSVVSCDTGLDIDSEDPTQAADALGVCEGVSSASWELPDGSLLSTPQFHLGHGILTGFGPNVQAQEGSSMLAISTGTARATADAGFVSPLGSGYDKSYGITLPSIPGFPSMGGLGLTGNPCSNPSSTGRDGIALKLNLVVPVGANAFEFSYKFYGADYPSYVCTQYVDQAAVVVNSSSLSNQNVLLTSNAAPVNVNTPDLQVCSPSGLYTCPLGTSELAGTGFEGSAATGWLLNNGVAVTPGESITVQFMMWDSGDGSSDSTLLVDHFRWYSSRSRHQQH